MEHTSTEPSDASSISVYLDGNSVRVYRGMKVKHALVSRDDALYSAACRGEILVVDENGFRVGLDGALLDGMRLFTRKREGMGPSAPQG